MLDSFKLRVGLAVLLADHLNAVTEEQLFGDGSTRASTGLTSTNTSVPAGALLAGVGSRDDPAAQLSSVAAHYGWRTLNYHLLPHTTGGAWHT